MTEQDIIELSGKAIERGQGGGRGADLLRRADDTRLRRADRAAARHPGRHQHAVGVLEGAAAGRRQRPCCGSRPDAGRSRSRCRLIVRMRGTAACRRLRRAGIRRYLNGMKARVTVTLKSGILDPQGKAIEGALKSLGVSGVASVRQGKVFDIEIEGGDKAQRRGCAEGRRREAARQHRDRELPHRGAG